MPTDQELALADDLGRALIRLVRLIERKRDRYHAEHPDGIERAAYVLLAHLVLTGPQRAGALAEAVHSDPSTISRQITSLVRLGYVQRAPDPEDGRATVLAASPAGRRVFEENRRRRNEHLAALLTDWSEPDRQALRELLGRFTTDLERADHSPPAAPPADRHPRASAAGRASTR